MYNQPSWWKLEEHKEQNKITPVRLFFWFMLVLCLRQNAFWRIATWLDLAPLGVRLRILNSSHWLQVPSCSPQNICEEVSRMQLNCLSRILLTGRVVSGVENPPPLGCLQMTCRRTLIEALSVIETPFEKTLLIGTKPLWSRPMAASLCGRASQVANPQNAFWRYLNRGIILPK